MIGSCAAAPAVEASAPEEDADAEPSVPEGNADVAIRGGAAAVADGAAVECTVGLEDSGGTDDAAASEVAVVEGGGAGDGTAALDDADSSAAGEGAEDEADTDDATSDVETGAATRGAVGGTGKRFEEGCAEFVPTTTDCDCGIAAPESAGEVEEVGADAESTPDDEFEGAV